MERHLLETKHSIYERVDDEDAQFVAAADVLSTKTRLWKVTVYTLKPNNNEIYVVENDDFPESFS
jgi:hypothetical protein